MTTHVNDAGTWRQLSQVHVNDAGTWRQINQIWTNDAGTWRKVFGIAVVNTYTGGSGTETVPAGATQCLIEVYGGGGAGCFDNVGGHDPPTGGGGGGYCSRTIAVVAGNTFSYSVPALVSGRSTNGLGANGGNATVTGTVSGGSVSMTANGGLGGQFGGGTATGGTASGGTTNTTGGSTVISTGAAAAGPAGGGSSTGSGNAPGGGGGGKTTGTSGSGARGQIIFTYS